MPAIRGIDDVVGRNLCAGCGTCAFALPDFIQMVDVPDEGRRPLLTLQDRRPPDTRSALAVCPGVSVEHAMLPMANGPDEGLGAAWGPVLEVWEGFAGDGEIRFAGSSGGAATALALHGLEREGMHGVLHIAARDDVPYLNRTVLSRSRTELLAATGSRYAPASPCDGLQRIVDAPAPCVFIGKPCDVAGADKARRQHAGLDANLGLTIAIFCAGTPSTQGTLEMVRQMDLAPEEVTSVRYRGLGWPGRARIRRRGEVHERTLSYEESWGAILQRHRQWRCRVCADHTGELADVSVGDPWYRDIPEGEAGRSLIVARTERGRRALHAAVASGALVAERVSPDLIGASQPDLLKARGAVWGRVMASRLIGVAAPRYRNMPTFRWWWRSLDTREKAKSTLGTWRRVIRLRLHRRRPVPSRERRGSSATPTVSPERLDRSAHTG